MRGKVESLLKWEWLIFILVGVFILRVPSLLEPYWYGDEGIYLTIGQAINRGSYLYSQIHDNKPPLLYWVASVADGNLFWFKMITLVTNLITVGIFARLATFILGKNGWGPKVAVIVFSLFTTLPFWEGNIANAELYFLPFTIAATLVLWSNNSYKNVFFAGFLLGMGALFKMPALLEMAVWPLVWLAMHDKSWWKKSIVLGAGCILPLAGSAGYFLIQGNLNEYWVAAWAQNLPYLSSWKAESGGTGIYSMAVRAILAAGAAGLLLLVGKKVGLKGLVVAAWGLIALFSALLSGRPYPHYLLQVTPALALGIALIGWGNKKERLVATGICLVTALAFGAFHFYAYPVTGYYKNFVYWTAGSQGKQSYYEWFNPQVTTNYLIAETVTAGSDPDEQLFVWGDEPVIYALSRRSVVGKYTVRYHIKDFKAEKETMEKLHRTPPQYIVSFGNEVELDGLEELLQNSYHLEKKIGNGAVYRLSSIDI